MMKNAISSAPELFFIYCKKRKEKKLLLNFHRLTGKKPFSGTDYKEVIRANRNCDIDFQKEIFKILPKSGKTFFKFYFHFF